MINIPLYKNIKTKIFNYCKNDNLAKHAIHPNNMLKLSKKTFTTKDNKTFSKEFAIGLSNIRGNIDKPDEYTIIQKTNENNHFGFNMGLNYSILYLKNKKEQINALNYLKLKIIRFCLSIVKINQNISCVTIPYLDFSRSWTDEEIAKELNITDEELLWIITQIKDFYDNDAEIYRALEEKLKNRI